HRRIHRALHTAGLVSGRTHAVDASRAGEFCPGCQSRGLRHHGIEDEAKVTPSVGLLSLEVEPRHFLISGRASSQTTAVQNQRCDGHLDVVSMVSCQERRDRLWWVDPGESQMRLEGPGLRREPGTPCSVLRDDGERRQLFSASSYTEPKNAGA